MKGHIAATTAFLYWGLVPVYWKLFGGVGAAEVIAHRILWSLAFAGILVVLRGTWRDILRALRRGTEAAYLTAAAVLLAVNWLTFVWAITHDRVADTSLGYFLCPLVSVALALIVEREWLSPRQWVAVGFGAAGVLWLFAVAPLSPVPALLIAFSWGGYGWCKRRVSAGPLSSLTAETALLAPVAAAYLAFLSYSGDSAFRSHSALLFVSSGLATALPLILFAYAARRIPLSALGFLNYLVPTVSLFLALFLYREPFSLFQGIGYGLIWVGLAIYSSVWVRAMRA